jgi:hypothetical protein
MKNPETEMSLDFFVVFLHSTYISLFISRICENKKVLVE